jgi:hypothetical protein
MLRFPPRPPALVTMTLSTPAPAPATPRASSSDQSSILMSGSQLISKTVRTALDRFDRFKQSDHLPKRQPTLQSSLFTHNHAICSTRHTSYFLLLNCHEYSRISNNDECVMEANHRNCKRLVKQGVNSE